MWGMGGGGDHAHLGDRDKYNNLNDLHTETLQVLIPNTAVRFNTANR